MAIFNITNRNSGVLTPEVFYLQASNNNIHISTTSLYISETVIDEDVWNGNI